MHISKGEDFSSLYPAMQVPFAVAISFNHWHATHDKNQWKLPVNKFFYLLLVEISFFNVILYMYSE